MKLKSDWTFAHFLYYITWFLIVGLILNFATIASVYLSGGNNFFLNAPGTDPLVEVAPENFVNKNIRVNDDKLLAPISVQARLMVHTDDPDFISKHNQLFLIRFLRLTVLVSFFFFLTRIFKSVIEQNPFESKNSARLYVMGSLLLGLTGVNVLHSYFIVNALSVLNFDPALHFEPVFEVESFVFFGLILMLLGYVFKEGTRIHEELKLTV